MPVDRLTVMNDIFNDDRGISEWRDEEMPAKRWSAKKKKGIINALNKKKRPVVAQIHNTEIKVKVWSFKLAPTNGLST